MVGSMKSHFFQISQAGKIDEQALEFFRETDLTLLVNNISQLQADSNNSHVLERIWLIEDMIKGLRRPANSLPQGIEVLCF